MAGFEGRRGEKIFEVIYSKSSNCPTREGMSSRRLYWGSNHSTLAGELLTAIGDLRQATELSAVVWDRAPSHQNGRVRAVEFPLAALPPYSPELNSAEQLFEELRRRIERHVYATFDDKYAAVEAALAELEVDPARMRSLVGRDRINTALAQLPTIQLA